ncbi:hypothetical protein ABZT48_21500 [Streptomyces avermitilis]|uniref:hypothetical protein n=1 Tax=Streptomyces avermitilis TaxID=33903 RepID=UPI0033A03331
MGRTPRSRLRPEESRPQAHRDDPVEFLQSDVRQRAAEEHARVVDQNVEHPEDPRIAAFLALVEGTPVLRSYAHRMWMRHQAAVAHAIAEEIGAPDDDATCAALARFQLHGGRLPPPPCSCRDPRPAAPLAGADQTPRNSSGPDQPNRP